MKKIKSLLIAVTLTGLSGIAVAEEIKVPKLLEQLQAEGAKLHKKFVVSEHLNGFAMTIGSDQVIVYSTPDGELLFNGSLLNNQSTNLTKGFEKKHLPLPDYSSAYEQFAKANGFTTHDEEGGKTLFVIHDPNCGYCRKAFNQIQTKSAAPGVKVRWLPVAALGENSLQKSAALLNADNPVQLQRDFDRGYQPTNTSEAEKFRQDVLNNTKMMKLIGASGTPAFMVVDNKSQQVIDIIHGYRPTKIESIWP